MNTARHMHMYMCARGADKARSGGVEADVTVTKLADNSWYMCTGGGTASHDRCGRHLRRPATDLLS